MFKKIATIKADDKQDGELITVGIDKFADEDGNSYYDVVADNGEDVSQGGDMAKDEAIESIYAMWQYWDTFEVIDD